MLDIRFINQNLSQVHQSMVNRGMEFDLDAVKTIDDERKAALLEIEDLRHRRNKVSEEIAALKKQKKEAAHIIRPEHSEKEQ